MSGSGTDRRAHAWTRGTLVVVSLTVAIVGTARAELFQRVDAYGVVHVALASVRRSSPRPAMRRSAFPSVRRPVGKRSRSGGEDRHVRYELHLRDAAEQYRLPVDLLRAVVRVESNFNPTVVSRKGAVGLMQLMPFNLTSMGVRDGFDPRQNILGGARLLRKCADAWRGDVVLALASYNAGIGAVQRYHGVPPFAETRSYVRRVLMHYRAYRTGRRRSPVHHDRMDPAD